jgi:hypothetical protein
MERTAPQQKTQSQISAEQRNAEAWLEHVMPQNYSGYVNNDHNWEIVSAYIRNDLDGWVTISNLSKACDACYLQLDGLGIHHHASVVAKAKAAKDKIIQDRRAAIAAETNRVVSEWTINTCPRALIVNGYLYPANAEAIIAYLRAQDARIGSGDISVTPEQLNQAVETLWDGGLAKFSSKPEDLLFRNQPIVERKMNRQARIDAGMQADTNARRSHDDDGKFNSLDVKKMKKIVEDRMGLPSEEKHWQNKAEIVSVNNRLGKFDHAKTAEIRKSFIYADAAKTIVDWKKTYELRNSLATQIEKEKNR